MEAGIRCVELDPVTVLTAMGMATTRLGLGATYSTTYYEPFHVARVFATLDHLTGGRAAWNVVTSVNDNERRNMGLAEAPAHDVRYDRADEFMEVVQGHWDVWEAAAIAADRASGLYAHGDRGHRLDHRGQWFSSRGPITAPRTPTTQPTGGKTDERTRPRLGVDPGRVPLRPQRVVPHRRAGRLARRSLARR